MYYFGEKLTITCKVTGFPVPTVTFTKDGKKIMKDSIITGEASIEIESMSYKDRGVYRCSAKNDKETDDDQFKIAVGKCFHLQKVFPGYLGCINHIIYYIFVYIICRPYDSA